jgi:hypothetical protein
MDFLGAMAQRGARCIGLQEECGGEGGKGRDALAVKGLSTVPKPLYRAWVRAHLLFHTRIRPSLLPHTHTAWQLPHYTERFSPYIGWECTGVNAWPFGSAEHSIVSFLASC